MADDLQPDDEILSGGSDPSPTPASAGDERVVASPPRLSPPDVLFNQRLSTVPLDPGMSPDSEVPGLVEQLKNAATQTNNPQVFEAVVKKLRTEANIVYQAQQQQERLNKQARQEYIGNIDNEWTPRLSPKSNNPLTVDEVVNDPRLKDGGHDAATLKQKYIQLIERQGKVDPAAENDTANRLEIFNRMLQPYGTEGKITTKSDIDYRYAYGQITENSYHKLLQEFASLQTVEGEKFAPRISALQKAKAGAIFGIMGLTEEGRALDAQRAARDGTESANDRMLRFHEDLMHSIKTYREQNKDPSQLFDPKSPNYLGNPESMKSYLPPVNQKPTPLQTQTEQNKKLADMEESELKAYGQQSIRAYNLALEEIYRRDPSKRPPPTGAPIGR